MPNMFSRRRGSSAHRPVDSNTSAAAATAASSAFLNRNSSHSSLSSAAAAAALRSQTTSPEPVGSIQTKRMSRRGSQSSISSSVIGSSTRGGVGRGGLLRNNSSGSMTERTFRSPSPGRNGSISAASDAPPVPTIPSAVRGGGHQRSASTEPVRRVTSPTPRANRGVSVDRGAAATPTTSRSSKRLSNVQESVNEDGLSSVNFSRPISSPSPSPSTTQKKTHSSGSWFTGASGSQNASDVKPSTRPASSMGLPSHEVSGIQAGLNSAASGPVKKRQPVSNAQGSHLARSQATDNTPTSIVTDSADTIMVYDPNSRKFVARPRTQAEQQQPTPPSPELPKQPAPAPGTYDPNTRKIVPTAPAGSSGVAVKRTRPSLTPVETELEPPPRNPARVSPQSSPVSPRAAGTLQKHPSIVREDPEAEDAEATASGSSYYQSARQHQRISSVPAKAYVASSTTKPRSGSLDVPRSTSSSDRGRGGSLSPSRSAHFSAAPVTEGIRHEPHRGVSPVKSAMKHSPASSVRTSSPMNSVSPVGAKATSDTSEAPSLEGLPKKKKSVRVSFDAAPQEIQPPVTPASSSVTRERSPAIDDDMDEIMKPRPALPSFGSVRRDRVQPEYAEKVTERPPDRHEASNDHAIGGIISNHKPPALDPNEPLPPEVTSKDGPSYISDESEDDAPVIKPQTIEVPSAPVVPAVQGTTALPSATEASEPVPAIGIQPPTPGEESMKKLGGTTPPASPKPKQEFSVPGCWAQEEEQETTIAPVASQPAPVEPKTMGSFAPQPQHAPATTVISPAPAAPLPAANSTAANLTDITESDSDDSAAFSDAAEDLSDLDEGGFASLDAIVESPAVPSPAAAKKLTTPPDSPSARQAAKQHVRGTDSSGDWSQATAYWSRLSRQQREQIEREHLSSDDEYRPQPPVAQRPKKKKSALKQPSAAASLGTQPPQATQQPSARARETAAAPQKQGVAPSTSMRKSMRGPQGPAPAAANEGVQMRSSMRDGGGGSMRTSMRGPPAQRPQSEVIGSRSTSQRQNARPMSMDTASSNAAAGGAMLQHQASPKEIPQDGPFPKMGSQQAVRPPPKGSRLSKQQPTAAEDSDSESSFKKKRRPSASTVDASGRYSMKRSMRAGSIDSEQARPISPTPEKRKAFSVRSLSPTGSFFGRNRQNLKESMRAPPAGTGVKTLRGPNSMKAGSGKTMRASAPARPATSSGNMTSKFKSRFADSDDEDDGGRPGGRSFFRSKFADSDDDEPGSNFIAADLTPVRGIPKRQGQEDGDSTDLSDEEEDPRKASRNRKKQGAPMVPDPADVEKAMEAARRNLGMTNGTTNASAAQTKQGGALSKGSLRQSQLQQPEAPETPAAAAETPKRRGFMGSILRRNKNSTSSVAQIAPSSPAAAIASQRPSTAVVPDRPMSPGPASPGSPRGKLVRRSTAQSRLSRMDSNLSTTAPPSDAPPLPTTEKTDNWPLAPPPKVTANGVRPASPSPGQTQADDRPMTSDGIHEQAVKLARTMRPDMSVRSSSARDTTPGRAGHVGFAPDAKMEDGDSKAMYSAKTGRKKKFGKLRRAFGLND